MNKIVVAALVLLISCVSFVGFAYCETDASTSVVKADTVSLVDSIDVSSLTESPKTVAAPKSSATPTPTKTPKPTVVPLLTPIPALTSDSYVEAVKPTLEPTEAPIEESDEDLEDLDEKDTPTKSSEEPVSTPEPTPKPTPKPENHSGISYRCVLTNQPNTFVVKWESVSGASKYQVQLSNYENMNGHQKRTATVEDPEISITNVDDSVDYYLRVRVKKRDGSYGSWSLPLDLRHPF